ncbi:MAG: di-heme oxidoredictase family protein, partial [Vicinamibacteria bacterium]
TVKDPEDTDNDIVAFTNFMRFLAPPPGDRQQGFGRLGARHHEGLEVLRGRLLFDSIGCAVCHRAGFTAASPIAAINGQRVDAYSDFLLHDVGTGDGIAQGGAPPNTLRTPPLWGVADSGPYLHDGSAATIKEAIRRHANQGAAAQKAFQALSRAEQEALLEFLDSI